MVDEVDRLLPLAPSPEQVAFCSGDLVALWQRLGLSALVTLAAVKNAGLAAGALTFPLWWPLLQAAGRNRAVRSRFRHVGFWRARVVDVEVTQRATRGRLAEPSLRVLVGDASGARSEVLVPFLRRYESIEVGEPAELLVLSQRRKFDSFKALKEVYLPESGLWLADYPYVSRAAFLAVSLDLDRERRAGEPAEFAR
ncbi:hypothetical protein WJX81_003292 [Elliptochloris bilobata]|uniref:Uncharacterized protein n=1 Tax=Elliptochloris bilobata TaxID=381761 RepID=A0AAW1S8T2_9CHLO